MLKLDIEIPLTEAPVVNAVVDTYSDRLRCDHPEVADGAELGHALRRAAAEFDRGRIVVMAEEAVAEGLVHSGYTREATIPRFYEGEGACAVLAYALDGHRGELTSPQAVAKVDELLESADPGGRPRPNVATRLAEQTDAAEIAALIDRTFDQYPTPSHEPRYIAGAIEEGIPFRIVDREQQVAACASADLLREAKTAELTDCATLPEFRGQGLMQAILTDLMGDLRDLGYPTAFTLARARIPGVNLAFQRLGFELRGRMASSCRIGGGLEDMNVWSRDLVA